jgi:hypothetical protein
VVIAILTANATRDASALAGTVSRTSDVAVSLSDTLSGLPIVGAELGAVSDEIDAAAADARDSGARTEEGADRLSILLALSIAFIPSVPILGFYLPVRIRRIREADRVRRSLQHHGDDPKFVRFLALRALDNLDYDRILAITETPYEDLSEGRHHKLAAAELRRMGIEPPDPS